MSEQQQLSDSDSHINFLEEEYGDEYESTYSAAAHFGVPQINIILISIMQEIKEMNRLFYNKFEAKQ